MISINYRDPRPVYEQIKDGFLRLMVSGVLAAGDKLPSVRELATQLSINPNTIQRAYRELELEGHIYSVPGKGSFASDTAASRESWARELLCSFDELTRELLSLGITQQQLTDRLKQTAKNQGGDNK